MRSVSQRLLIFVTLLLLLFFGVMIALLDARFRKLSERSLTELLDAQMMALIASAEPDSQGLVVPRLQEDESRLNRTGSGLYAAVLLDDEQLWRSPSATGYVVDFGNGLAPGDRSFGYLRDTRGARLAALGRARLWENVSGVLTFVVATDMKPYDDQLSRFRKTLFRDFAVVAVLLLLALAATLRWLLAPLRRLAAQIGAVERGEREQLDDRWPTELAGVVSNLNTLLEAERVRIARYRDTLGNLAHSLKTPLAVLRTTFAPGAPGAAQVNEQVDRMSAIVEHQLRRAGTSGGTSVAKHAVDVLPVAQDLRGALLKVHGKRDFALEIVVPPEVQFVGDRDDLTEALGNLMDNAAKWCRSQVRVTASLHDNGHATQRLRIVVEDDGRGIAPADRTRVFERGARADEHTPGHGLGLAMVREMAGLYGGHLGLGESTLGGACLELRLPGRLR